MKPIQEWLYDIAHAPLLDKEILRHAYQGFLPAEKQRLEQRGYTVYTGKVRELVLTPDALVMYHSDRLSAFDRFIGFVPYKGIILADISQYWFEFVGREIPTHFISRPEERIISCIPCQPFKVEVVVRGYMAGSMGRAYLKGARPFCGQTLPEGLSLYRPLPKPIITPTSKAATYEHDEDISPQELVARGICSAQEWEEITTLALHLFRLGQAKFAEKGWILVDTKYEFGRDAQGVIRVIDELHTPDSSRLWVQSTYDDQLKAGLAPEMLDKEIVRRYLLEQGFSGEGAVPCVPPERFLGLARSYLHVAETLLAHPLSSVGPRLQAPELPATSRS